MLEWWRDSLHFIKRRGCISTNLQKLFATFSLICFLFNCSFYFFDISKFDKTNKSFINSILWKN